MADDAEDPKTPLLFEPEDPFDDGDDEAEEDFRDALLLAVQRGRIMASCEGCRATLTDEQYRELRCGTCGPIDHEALVFTVPN